MRCSQRHATDPAVGLDGHAALLSWARGCLLTLPHLEAQRHRPGGGPVLRRARASPKKKPISKRAVSGASEPWMALRSMLAAKRLRMVPSAAFAGLVAPITSRSFAMASSRSSDQTTRALGHELDQARRRRACRDARRRSPRRLRRCQAHHAQAPGSGSRPVSITARISPALPGGHGVGLDDGKSTLTMCLLRSVHFFFEPWRSPRSRPATRDTGCPPPPWPPSCPTPCPSRRR